MNATTLEKPASEITPPIVESRRPRMGIGVDKVVLILLTIYFLTPLITTLVFALSDGNNFSMQGLNGVFSDPDFTQSLLISLELSLASTLMTIVLIAPTVYWVQMRLPRARIIMDILALVPFAVPAIVMAFGLIEVYANATPLVNILSLGLVPFLSNVLNIYNTPQLLACSYVIVSLPFAFRPIDNNLRAINTNVLSEAASSLGCGWWRTFLTIILPNIWPGIISASLLTFSTAMGEFTLASMFGLETFPVYLNVTGQNDAHKAAALTILSFLVTLLCVLGITLVPRLFKQRATGLNKADLVAIK